MSLYAAPAGYAPLLRAPRPRTPLGPSQPQWFGVNLVDGTLPQVNKNPSVLGVDYNIPSDAQVAYLATRGLRLLRVNTCWEALQPTIGGPLTSALLTALDHLFSTGKLYNCRMILSIMNEQFFTSADGVKHIVGGTGGAISAAAITAAGAGLPVSPSFTVSGGGSGFAATLTTTDGTLTGISITNRGSGYVSPVMTVNGGTGGATVRLTCADGVVTAQHMYDFWTALATHFRGACWGYDIMNEPSQFATWDAQAQGLITAIRAVDAATTIIAQMTAVWTTYTDPANNIIYSIHRYFDGNPTGPGFYHNSWESFGSFIGQGISNVVPFGDWCRQHFVRGFFGEYGIPRGIFGSSPVRVDDRYLTVLNEFLTTIERYSDVLLGGTYFSAGQYYDQASYYDQPWDQSVLPASGALLGGPDAAQMAVLLQHPTTASY